MVLTNTVFRVISAINKAIPKDNQLILLYSNLGFRDNVAYLYNHLIDNEYNKKYKIIRSQNDKCREIIPKNVKVVSNTKGILYFLRAGHVFYCFGKLPIYPSKHQIVIQMWHGTPFKDADEWQKATVSKQSYYTYLLMSSHYFDDIAKKYYGVKEKNIAICGQPRTDVMFKNNPIYKELKKYKKIVIWMPTFRKSTLMGYSNTSRDLVIPILNSDDFKDINDWLGKKGVCVLVKLHPMQDISSFENLNLSNLYLLSHLEFVAKGWDLYRLIGQSDALITDYSSVFYDFMLLNRPMAFTVDDYDDYKDNRGFAVQDPDYLTPGYKIKTKADFKNFIVDIESGIDKFEEPRKEVNKLVNTFNDGKQCERVLALSKIE